MFETEGADEDFLAIVNSVCAGDVVFSSNAPLGRADVQPQPFSVPASYADVQQKFSDALQQLNIEICELLLQWEEDDVLSASSHRSRNSQSSACSVCNNSPNFWRNSNAHPRQRPEDPSEALRCPGCAGHVAVRDTGELLQALRRVDADLAGVDVWLGEQIDHLSSVQGEIKQIQSESSALEISWQNLTRIQALVKSIVNNLQITAEEEDLITKADKHLRSILNGSVVVTTSDFEGALAPLLAALRSLVRALGTSVESVASCTPEEWEHVKLSAGVLQQLEKLNNVAAGFCTLMNDMMTTIYSLILKHRALNDSSKSNDSVIIRRYSFSTLSKEIQEASSISLLSAENASLRGRVKNQLLAAQNAFHTALKQFLPVLDATIVLVPTNLALPLIGRSRRAYVESVQQLLYSPLIKQLFKELLSAVAVCPPQTLATIPRSRAAKVNSNNEMNSMFVQYSYGIRESSAAVAVARPHVFRVWDALVGAAHLLGPVIAREREFFSKLLCTHPEIEMATLCSRPQNIKTSASTESISVADAEKELFVMCNERLLKLAGSTDFFGSLDIAALLITVDRLIRDQGVDERVNTQMKYIDATTRIISRTDSTSASFVSQFVGDIPSVVLHALLEARTQLLARFEQFLSEQILWIQSGKGGSAADAKRLGVFPLFAKLPFLFDQLQEYCCGESFDYVTRMCSSICKTAVDWLSATASQSDKYHDAILIQNLAFFELTLETRKDYSFASGMARLLDDCQRQRAQAETQYIMWMVRYQMPDFYSLAERVASVEKRANRDELSLYIRRQDVLKVLGAMDPRGVEASIVEMRKRFDKHFASPEAQELQLQSRLWSQLREYLVATVDGVDALVQASYQLTFPIRPEEVAALIDKSAASYG